MSEGFLSHAGKLQKMLSLSIGHLVKTISRNVYLVESMVCNAKFQCQMAVCFAFKIAILISTSKNTVYFLLLLMSSLQQNWRRGQNRFCLEARGGQRRKVCGALGKNVSNNVCTYE
jgi:hypothetical protein